MEEITMEKYMPTIEAVWKAVYEYVLAVLAYFKIDIFAE